MCRLCLTVKVIRTYSGRLDLATFLLLVRIGKRRGYVCVFRASFARKKGNAPRLSARERAENRLSCGAETARKRADRPAPGGKKAVRAKGRAAQRPAARKRCAENGRTAPRPAARKEVRKKIALQKTRAFLRKTGAESVRRFREKTGAPAKCGRACRLEKAYCCISSLRALTIFSDSAKGTSS